MNTQIEPILLSVADACRLLGVGRTTFYALRSTEDFPRPRMLGKVKRWHRAELEAWIEKRARAAA